MAIQCPYCQHGMSVKDAKPGRYKPKCSKCGQPFRLTIYPDSNRPPLSEPLVTDAAPAAKSAEPAKRVDPAPKPPKVTSPSPDATLVHEKTTVSSPDATVVTPAKSLAPIGSAPTSYDTVVTPEPGSTDATLATVVGNSIPSRQVAPPSSTTRAAIDATIPAEAAATVHARAASAPAKQPTGVLPDRIGGYKIVKELGRGAMGAVYLARQLSLDRDVALKTIQAQWAENPTFIARFVREAYAAAQLTHHNIVQIYDLGTDGGSNFFSMEFVRGESLEEVVKRSGPLPPEQAVGYTLQAARGLRFAHQHGMVHRDVKPANMMLNDQGIVKIADLGLVKVFTADSVTDDLNPTPSGTRADLAAARADVTTLNVAMGTPAFMAPEQAESAADVDHRADIYSLGCSLYVMLTGQPLFDGVSAIEVITKHRTAAVVRPDLIVTGIPKQLADITLKMVVKQPEQRYQNLDEVIRDLENFLAGGKAEKVAPTEDQATLISQGAEQFNKAPLAKIRSAVLGAFIAATILLPLVLAIFSPSMALALIILSSSAVLTYFVLSGIKDRSPLFDRFRTVAVSASWFDWLQCFAGVAVFMLVLWLLGWLPISIAAGIGGAAGGFAYWFAIDRRLAEQRRAMVANIETVLRGLRLRGLDESTIQQFVASNSGRDWEELFEALFGFEAKLEMRNHLSQSATGAALRRFATWREPLVRSFDARIKAKRDARDRAHLRKLEEKNLTAQGLDPEQARQHASRIANALVQNATSYRAQPAQQTQVYLDPAAVAAAKRERIRQMLADAKAGSRESRPSSVVRALAPVRFVLSGGVRFLLGCLLLAGCALWAKQNNMISTDDLRAAARDVSQNVQSQDLQKLTNAVKSQTAQPLEIPVIGKYFDSWYPGIAGIMLLVLGLFRGWKMSLFALPAAALIVIGPAFGPRVVMLLAGLVVGGIGLFFGRTSE